MEKHTPHYNTIQEQHRFWKYTGPHTTKSISLTPQEPGFLSHTLLLIPSSLSLSLSLSDTFLDILKMSKHTPAQCNSAVEPIENLLFSNS